METDNISYLHTRTLRPAALPKSEAATPMPNDEVTERHIMDQFRRWVLGGNRSQQFKTEFLQEWHAFIGDVSGYTLTELAGCMTFFAIFCSVLIFCLRIPG